jgi:O-antigen ligase
MEATREWRLNWWKDIINYTVHGRYFWTGKGFGINLAEDDGYEVLKGGELRSPHNGHMVILARSGVPGATLWLLTQGVWITAIVSAYLRARKLNDRRWCAVFAFILAYWTGFMVNASFDVFLEGPMGGVWFWSLYGIGLSASWIFKHSPETMYPEGRAPERMQPPSPSRLPRPSWNRLATPVVG